MRRRCEFVRPVVSLCVAAFSLALCAPGSSSAAQVVACVGNSITEFYYPAELGKLLGADYTVRDFGQSGMCAIRAVDTSYWNCQDFLNARASNPQFVIIKLGTNDSKVHNWVKKDDFFKDLKTMAVVFASLASHPKVYVARPLPAFTNTLGIRGDVIHDEVVPLVDSVGKSLAAAIPQSFGGVIDCHTPFLGHQELFKDGVHPTSDGFKKLAQIMYNALTGTSTAMSPARPAISGHRPAHPAASLHLGPTGLLVRQRETQAPGGRVLDIGGRGTGLSR